MNTKKNIIRSLVVIGVVLILYCLSVFTLPFVRNTVFWLSFIFTLIAILAQIYVLKISMGREAAKSKFYGFPIIRVGVSWLVIQLVIGVTCMALDVVLPVWAAVVLFAIIFGAAVIGLITVDAIRDEVEYQDVELGKKVTTMRALQSQSASIAAQCEDAHLRKMLHALAEQFRFSDPVSSFEAEEAEAGLVELVDLLQTAVAEGDPDSTLALITRIEAALAERNRLCKLNK